MSHEVTELLVIDNKLRFVLYGISILLGINMRAVEIERLFEGAASSDSRAQSYEFHRSPRVSVTGLVDEHEPETVWLSVAAPKFDQAELKRLIEAAEHVSFGLARAERPHL